MVELKRYLTWLGHMRICRLVVLCSDLWESCVSRRAAQVTGDMFGRLSKLSSPSDLSDLLVTCHGCPDVVALGVFRLPSYSYDSFHAKLQYSYLKPLTPFEPFNAPPHTGGRTATLRIPETAWKIREGRRFIPHFFLRCHRSRSLRNGARWTLHRRRRSHEARRCFRPPLIALPRADDGPAQLRVPRSVWVHSHPLPGQGPAGSACPYY